MEAPPHTHCQPWLAPPAPTSQLIQFFHLSCGWVAHMRSREGLSFLTPIFKKPELEDWSRWLRQGSWTSTGLCSVKNWASQ